MKKWKKLLGWTTNLCIILAIGAVFYLSYQVGFLAFSNKPLNEKAKEGITIEIKEGDGQTEVVDALVEEGYLENFLPFTLRYVLSEYRGKIQPGTYEINGTMGIDDILYTITQRESAK